MFECECLCIRMMLSEEVTKFLTTPVVDTTSFFARQCRTLCGCNGMPLAWVANMTRFSMTISVRGNFLYNSTNSLRLFP